jgi:hypothetical protein
MAVLLLAVSVGLSGCFDLTQKIAIDRKGAGHYQVSVAASGLIGEALKEKPVKVGLDGARHVSTTITEKNGRVTQSSSIAFARLSDLKLSDELISLRVLSRPYFGLGPAHVRFRRTFLVGNARRDNADRIGSDDATGSQIMASVFGDHTYTFSVTLPGSILRIAPVKVGDALAVPTVTGDFYHGHTITWTLPLYRALSRKMLTFEVDFSAYGSFADTQSMPEGKTSL